MPVLLNTRHELFAQEVAKGACGLQAYLSAGFISTKRAAAVSANRLLHTAKVQARVCELQAERATMHAKATADAAASLMISQQWLIERAEEARAMAMENSQPSAAVAAIKEIGILSGHRVEKRENLNRSMDQMSDEELMVLARGDTLTKTAH